MRRSSIILFGLVIPITSVVLTVGIAWACRNSPHTGPGPQTALVFETPNGPVMAWEFSLRRGVTSRQLAFDPSIAAAPEGASAVRPPAWSLAGEMARGDEPTMGFEDASGWPFRAMYLQQADGRMRRHASIDAFGREWTLPLGIAGTGFVLNTGVFLVSLTGMIVLGRSGRAALRRARSRCPKCAHILRGLSIEGCPECGWRRSERR